MPGLGIPGGINEVTVCLGHVESNGRGRYGNLGVLGEASGVILGVGLESPGRADGGKW